MQNIINKLTSRKFLLALVGVVSGLALAFGVEGSEIMEVVSTVAGIVTALGSIVAYNAAEAKVDAAAASTPEALPMLETDEGVDAETLDIEQLRAVALQMGLELPIDATRADLLDAIEASAAATD